MNHVSGFNALSNEMLRLIQVELRDEISNVCALTKVCKCFYEFFNSFLCENVSLVPLPILALPGKEYLPLSSKVGLGNHPASYVKKLSIGTNKDVIDVTVLRKQMISFIKNIEVHCSSVIKSLMFWSTTISLPEVFGNTIPPALTSIEWLSLRCPFPSRNTRLNLSLVKCLCVILRWKSLESYLNHNMLMAFPDLSSNFQTLINGEARGLRLINPSNIFWMTNSSDFLTYLSGSVYMTDGPSMAFFLQHSKIQKLFFDKGTISSDLEPQALLKLRQFEGTWKSGIALSATGSAHPIEHIRLTISRTGRMDRQAWTQMANQLKDP